ncbi:MAG: TrkH family potassium uptake protein [Rhodospirillaceae bacterium]|nr:TrkH family potassium uptake protein [Rhodospirillaceae bacterium]
MFQASLPEFQHAMRALYRQVRLPENADRTIGIVDINRHGTARRQHTGSNPMSRLVFVVLGLTLFGIGVLMDVPAMIDVEWDNPDWWNFLASSILCLFVGGAMVLMARTDMYHFDIRHGYALTIGCWILVSMATALPFWISGLNLSFTDSVFEAVSGLTTTGATVITSLGDVPPGMLIWRGMLQWIGGIGIIVMAIFMLPLLRVGGMQLFRIESSESSEKTFPRVSQFISAIVGIYVALTLICFVALHLEGMTTLEAVVHAMTTISTGGFSTADTSIKHFNSPIVEWTLIIFMLAGAIPFLFYVRLLRRSGHSRVIAGQVRNFLLFLVVIIIVISLWLASSLHIQPLDAIRYAAFDVISVVTTTGFVSEDYGSWGGFAAVGFFFLMFVGGCTGSTAGSIKFMRFEIGVLALRRELRKIISPNGVFPFLYHGQKIQRRVVESVLMLTLLYVGATIFLAISLSLTGLDFTTSFSGAVSAVGNVGPGLGEIIGPAGNYSSIGDSAKWLLIVGMILGRLEVMTVLVFLSPHFWRDGFSN